MNRPSDNRLADWLHGVTLDPTGGELEANRARLQAITAALSVTNIIELFAYAYQHPGDADAGFHFLVTAVRESGDETWSAEPNSGLALRLAAGAVADLLGAGGGDVTAIAAQAVRSAGFSGRTAPLEDLPGLASTALGRIGAARRRRASEELPPLEDELKGTIKEITIAEGDGAVQIEQLRAILEKSRTAVRNVARRVDSLEIAAHARRRMVDEELDVLWWSQGGVSHLLSNPWEQAEEAATLLAPLELASLLRLQPPPRSSVALIGKTLEDAGLERDGEVSLASAVEAAVAASSGRELVAAGIPEWLFPVSAALDECQRKNGEAAWAAAYQAEFDVDPAGVHSRVALADQLLGERSLYSMIGSGVS